MQHVAGKGSSLAALCSDFVCNLLRRALVDVKHGNLCALTGESGVVGPDENKGAEIRACEFPRIRGGKPFNVRKGSFRKMLTEIGQPNPRKKRIS